MGNDELEVDKWNGEKCMNDIYKSDNIKMKWRRKEYDKDIKH